MGSLGKLSRSISGRVAIVTGAASGMGRATAHLLSDEGAVIAVCDINSEGVDRVVKEIRDAGGFASGYVIDLEDGSTIDDLVSCVREELGSIDILVNNAGVSLGGNIDNELFEDVWKATFSVNLDAQMRLIRSCLSDLQRNGDGRIVNIASTEGLGGSAGTSPYTASKHGVVGLTKSLAVELGPMGITVNAICPGPIHTGMTELIPDDAKEKFARRRTALKRYGDPEEVAHITLSLVLPSASYITGTAIPVDGGMRARNN
ncbi:MAG: 3-oxoacyl-ACP reductase [Acidimicrobiaceae bacterium]|nr:3-oxoacyl-ACP reductase [Acidimicrobiaceae bacterium]